MDEIANPYNAVQSEKPKKYSCMLERICLIRLTYENLFSHKSGK